jgi:uncharacterized protein (DUF2147 family)
MTYGLKSTQQRSKTFRSGMIAIAALTTLLASGAQAAGRPPSDLVGIWLDHTGRGAVELAPCGNRLCGRIVWLQDPNDKNGRPFADGNNPRRALRGRPICGLQIIGNLKHVGRGVWDRGWIYDPEKGERYDVELRRKGNRLRVLGYAGLKFLSETMYWTQAPEDLKVCAASAGG